MKKEKSKEKGTLSEADVLASIVRRAHYLLNQMIYMANHRDDKEKGDPKVGGHSSGSSSSVHILGALHLIVRSGFDHLAVKPHASPCDHAYNYLLDLLLKEDFSRLTPEEADVAMTGLRAFSQQGEPVFQSYHSIYDPDHHNFFPSGTVGIPPVQAGYLAHAYRFAAKHGYHVPPAHFWSLIGDSEFREGSLFEAIPDLAEREVGNLTWILDYNRQSLDGHRITNRRIMGGTDDRRIARTMAANGWEVLVVQHGPLRRELFKRPGGAEFREWLEDDLDDYELQSLLLLPDGKTLRQSLKSKVIKTAKKIQKFLSEVEDQELFAALRDLGGHDFASIVDALEQSKKSQSTPSFVIVHTLKGWGLEMAAAQGNHSALPSAEEMARLQENTGLTGKAVFSRFAPSTPEGAFLKKRGDQLYGEILEQNELKRRNQELFQQRQENAGEMGDSLKINLGMASYPHTQWMMGQLTAKLTRIGNAEVAKLPADEKSWQLAGEMLVPMAPDVGTSTNLNPAMDGKIFGAHVVEDVEQELHVKDRKAPDLVPDETTSDRFLRFEIAEANAMSCLGSYGRMRDILGIPFLPLMSVYDFFIKRALDQYFYILYWRSSFILVGTPSGVTLSPEGAQHGWKSDFQIPGQITWEPFFCQELDWIFADAVKRHFDGSNLGRSGVLIRGVTRGVEQKDFLRCLRRHRRFKVGLGDASLLAPAGTSIVGGSDESQVPACDDNEILAAIRQDVLEGAYFLIDYRGYAGYEPGDNVVHIFAMGALGTEAIKASDRLLSKGIYANVIMVTSPDLLVGHLAHANDFRHLREKLGVNSDLILNSQGREEAFTDQWMSSAELLTLAGRRVPIVSVHDGEPGLLDNIGSIVGVRHLALAVRKHSRCGRPKDVYAYHGIDADAVVEACGKVLAETALENLRVSPQVLEALGENIPHQATAWKDLWPS